MTLKRLSLTTTGAELDRSVLRSGRLLDTLNRSSMALGVLDSELYDAAHRSGLLTVLGRFRCLDVHFVLSDEERVLESRCRQKNLGIWVGDSQSRASAEIEFSCKNTAKASAIVRELLESSSANFTLQVLAD